MDWVLKHKIVAILGALVIAIAAWYFLSGSSTPAPVLTSEQPAGAPPGTQQLIQSLLSLRAVNLSGTIFSNPAFQALQDFTTPVVPEPVGRSDPFAPLSAGAQTTANAAKAAALFAPVKP